jgi:hypothetical protein
MPGGGENSRRQNRRWFLRGRRGIYPTEAEPRISLFLLEYCQIASVAQRKSGKCFADIYLPPGFGAVNFPLPRATREAFRSIHLNFFTASLFQRGKRLKEFPLQSLASSPPFEKGRKGWISGRASSKHESVTESQISPGSKTHDTDPGLFEPRPKKKAEPDWPSAPGNGIEIDPASSRSIFGKMLFQL